MRSHSERVIPIFILSIRRFLLQTMQKDWIQRMDASEDSLPEYSQYVTLTLGQFPSLSGRTSALPVFYRLKSLQKFEIPLR